MTARLAAASPTDNGRMVDERVVLTTAVVDEICRRHALPASAPARTWVGATSSIVQLTDGLGLKVPHRGAEAVAACRTHALMAEFARSVGVNAPQILGVEEDAGLVPVPVFVTSLFEGESLRPGDADPRVWEAVGAELASLHAVAGSTVPSGLRTFRQHPAVDPRRLLEQQRAADEPDGPVERLAALLELLAAGVVAGEHPVLCHGDVHAQNIIADDGRYVGLVDLAGSGVLDAAWDFAGIPAPAVRPALRGHHAAGGGTDGLLERIVWCRVQLAVHRAAAQGTAAAARTVRATLAEAEALLA